MPSGSKGSGAASGTPGQATQAPSLAWRMDSRAVTSPPGLAFQCSVPSGSRTRSTGRRLATTTKSAPAPAGGRLVVPVIALSSPVTGRTSGLLGVLRLRADPEHVQEHAALLGVR